MPLPTKYGSPPLYRRIVLWFVSVLLAIAFFTLPFALVFTQSTSNPSEAVYFFFSIFSIALIFALPVACLYLPLVITFSSAENSRPWAMLIVGALIGPIAMLLWYCILLLRGNNAHGVWYGDPVIGMLGSAPAAMIFAFIVGTITTLIYLLLLRISSRRIRTDTPAAE